MWLEILITTSSDRPYLKEANSGKHTFNTHWNCDTSQL